MNEALNEVRYEIRAVRNSIRDRERSIREHNKRLEDINEAIGGYSIADYYADSINNNLSTTAHSLESGLSSSNKNGAATELDSLKEKGSYSDDKTSTAIYQLKQEKNIVINEINSDRNEINSLSYSLSALRDKERSLLSKMI